MLKYLEAKCHIQYKLATPLMESVSTGDEDLRSEDYLELLFVFAHFIANAQQQSINLDRSNMEMNNHPRLLLVCAKNFSVILPVWHEATGISEQKLFVPCAVWEIDNLHTLSIDMHCICFNTCKVYFQYQSELRQYMHIILSQVT